MRLIWGKFQQWNMYGLMGVSLRRMWFFGYSRAAVRPDLDEMNKRKGEKQ